MMAPTHIAFGLFTTTGLFSLFSLSLHKDYPALGAAILGALLPDIDSPNSSLGRWLPFVSVPLERRWGHRTVTHCLLAVGALGVVSSPLIFYRTTMYSALLIGYLSHLLADCGTKSGVPLFHPHPAQCVLPGNSRYRVTTGSLAEQGLLGVLLVLLGLVFPLSRMGGTWRAMRYLDVNGQYGPQFMYTVEQAGQRDKLYATPSLHRQLQEAQVGPGCVLTITKIEGEGNRKEWVVEPEAEAEAEAVPEPEDERAEEADWQPVAGKRNGNGQPTAAEGKPNGQRVEHTPAASASGNGNGKSSPEGLSFASLELAMNRSLRASWEAWCALEEGPAFSGEDVRAVAITLFLECARKGIVLQPERVGEEVPF